MQQLHHAILFSNGSLLEIFIEIGREIDKNVTDLMIKYLL